MKHGWEIKKLGEVCDFQGGSQPPKEEWIDEPREGYVRMLQIRDFTQSRSFDIEYVKESNRLKYCNEDDVLLGRYGASVGKVLTGLAGAYNVAIMKTIPNRELLNKQYFKYFLQSPSFQIFLQQASTMRAAQAGFSKENIQDFTLPVPPLPVQERIVSELDLLNGIIEKKREQLKELDALAQSIFYDMFGDPITNEKGWEVKKLGEVCKVNPSKKDTSIGLSNSDIVSFLPMEDLPIKACYHSPKQTRLFSEVQSSYTCFANNDVLMAKVTPCFENGKIGIASNLMNGIGYGSSEFIVIRANNIDVIKEYPYFVIQNTSFIENACAQLTGTSGLRRVPRQYVENCNISIPPLPLQHQFATKIEAIEKQKELIKQSISETETLFNARMQEHFG